MGPELCVVDLTPSSWANLALNSAGTGFQRIPGPERKEKDFLQENHKEIVLPSSPPSLPGRFNCIDFL